MAKLEQGFIGLDDNSLIMQWNVDAYGNPVSIHINNEIQQVSSTHHIIQLAQIPDEYYRVKFVAELIRDYLVEVRNRNEVKNINQYYVDYQHGIVYFHQDLAGRLVRADYYGRGVVFLSDARIFHRNEEGFAVTLDEVLEKSKDGLKLLDSVGGLAQAIDLLEDKTDEGNAVADRIENFIKETEFYGYTIVLSREAFVVRAKDDGSLHKGELDDLTVDVVVYKGAKSLTAPDLTIREYSTTNCSCSIEGQTITITDIDIDAIQGQAIIEIDCGDGLIAHRTIEVTKVFDGVSQFNVEMTNSFYSFDATHSGKIEEEQSVTCEFEVTKANEIYTDYVVGVQNMPNGITCNLTEPTKGATNVTFTAKTGTGLPDNGSISVVFQFSDYIVTKTFAFTKSKAGLSAKSLRLAGNQIIHYENPNYEGTPNPLRTSIVAQVTDLSGTPVWSYLEGEEWIVIDGQNGTNLNLYHNDRIWTNKRELTIKCELDGFSDEITLIKIANGATGVSSYSVVLSNESTTLRVGLDGKIPAEEVANQYTRVTAFKGADQITPTEINIPESNLYKVAINGSTINLLDVDSSSITVNIPIEIILDNAVVIEKEWSIAKTERGEIGASGSVYTLNVEGGTRSIVYNQLDKNPRPSYSSTFYAYVYENGNDITSKVRSWYWTCQGHLIGTSISNTFTPEIKEKFNDTILNNSVTVTAIYNHTPISYTVPIVVSKDASGLDWVTDWDSRKVLVRDTEVLTPKLFAGSYDKTHDLITGVAIGTDVLNDGQTQGIVGYQNNNISFLLGTDGSLLVGNPFEDFGSGISYNDGQLIINVDDISIAGATVPTWDDLETELSDHSKEIILTLQSNIDDMNNTLNDVTNHVDAILKDGLITELEKVQLDALFEMVQQEMNNIRAQYDSVINNPYLLSDVIENLQKHYRNYMDAYDNIIVVYNDIFKEGTVEEIEYDIMDDEYLEADDFSLEIVEPIDEQDILDDEYLQSEDFGLEVIDEVNEVSLDTLITRDGHTIVTLDGDVFRMVTENTLLDFQDAVQVLRNYSAILQQAINEALLTITENRASILINEAREEIRAEIGDVNSALMDLEDTMNGDFKSGLIGLQSRAILEERIKQLEIQKSDVDGQYEVLKQSSALDNYTKEVLALAKYDLDTAHDLLVAKINQTIVDNLITESELSVINSMISEYANELQQYSKVAQECNAVIAEKIANLAVEAITDEDVFNKVTNFGVLQGLFLKDEKVYINSEYINTRNFKAVTDDGKETFKIDENGEVSITAKSLSITGQSNLATQDYVNTQIENLTNTNVTFTLSNEFQIIPTDESYYPLNEGTYSITVKGYLGSSEETKNFTIGKVNSSSGIVAVVSNINKTIVFTVSPDAPLEDVSGYIDIPITYDGKQFNKRWSWAVSKQGNQATYVTITGEQFFKYKNNYTGTPTPSTITLTANVFNSTETGKWQYSKNGVWTDCGVTTKTLTLSPNDYTLATTQSVFVRYYVDSVFDTYSVTAISDGLNGTDGIDGVNSFFYIRYSANANGYPMTLEPQSDTKYMGTCSTTSETAPSTVGSYKWSLIKGQDGTDGIVGKDGEDGKSSYLHIRYSNDGVNFTPNNGEDIGTYIGTYVDFIEADSNNFADYSWKKFVGDDGTSVTSIEERYYLSNSQQALSGGSWKSSAPTWVSGKYIWTKTIFRYSDNTIKETTPICVTGKDGVSGGVNNVDIMYYQSTSPTTLTGGSWNTEAPTWSNTKYIWTKTVTTLTDGSRLESNPVCVTGAKGATGAGAKSVRIVSSSQVFKSSDGGLTYSPSNIKLTTVLQNVSFANWKYSVDAGVNWLSVVSGQDGLTISSNNLTVSKDSPLFEGTSGVVFRVNTTTSSIYDTITISKIKDVDDMQIGITNLYKNTKYISKEQWINISSWDTTELYNGYTVIKRTGAWQGIYQSNIEMVPYEKYTLSAFVKGDGVATIEAYASDATIYSYNNFTHRQIAPTEWTRVSFTFDCEYNSTDGAKPRFENSVDGATLQLYGIKFEKGNIATDWSPNSDDLENSYTVLLTNEAQVIPTDENRKPTENITFITKVQVFHGTAERTEYIIGNILDGYGIDVSQDMDTVYFTVNPNTTLTQDSGNFTIPITIDDKTFEKSFSWSCSKQGVSGKDGQDGKDGSDAITILLTNENHTFVANHLGSTAEQIIYTDIIAYKGSTPVTPTIGKLPDVTGLTLSNSGVRITIKANYGLELADSGSFNIPITVDGQAYNKTFSWTKVKDGQSGANGANAKSVDILASNMIFKSTDGGTTFTPDTITLTPKLQNLTYSNWQYSTNGGSTWSGLSNSITGWNVSDKVLTINKSCSLFTKNTTSVVFRLNTTDSSFYDIMTITKLYDVADVDFEGIAEDVAQEKVDELDRRLNQQAVFNRLTNNGESQGLFLDENGDLYINGEYIEAHTIKVEQLEVNGVTVLVKDIVDTTVDDIEIGTKNLLSNTSEPFTMVGTNTTNQTSTMYHFVNKDNSPIIGYETVFSCKYALSKGATGGVRILTNGQKTGSATEGRWYTLYKNEDVSTIGTTGEISTKISFRDSDLNTFTGVSLRLDNFVGAITISECSMVVGNKATNWTPAPEDIQEDVSNIQGEVTDIEQRLTNAEFKVKDDSIISLVSKQFATKDELNDLLDGGENLIINSDFKYGFEKWKGSTTQYELVDDDYYSLKYTKTDLTEAKNYQVTTHPINVLDLVGKELTLTFDYKIIDKSIQTNTTIAYIRFFDVDHKDSSAHADSISATNVYYPSDYTNNKRATAKKTVTVPTGAAYVRVGAYQNQNGDIRYSKFQLEVGNKATAWKANSEDAKLYTDEITQNISEELKNLGDIFELNNGIDSMTPTTKVKLIIEYNDTEALFNGLLTMSESLGVEQFSLLIDAMSDSYDALGLAIETIQATITETDEEGLGSILAKFSAFYSSAEILNQAILNSLKEETKYVSTQIEQLTESINFQITSFNTSLGQITTRFIFDSDGLTIKSSANATKYIKLDNDSLDFMDNNTKVAEITNQQLNISKATITKEMKVSNMKIKPSGSSGGGVIFVFE